jgi:SAM-dependent methyltransferase
VPEPAVPELPSPVAVAPAAPARGCDACRAGELVAFADLGTVPVQCGAHWPERAGALASPAGQMTLGYCPSCAYVRNLRFEPELVVYDATMDMNLHHSPAVQQLTAELAGRLADRLPLAGARVLDLGCAQGELLRELCRRAGCTGTGWDPAYTGPVGADPSGASFHAGFPPRGDALPPYDAFVSRHWLEHLADPYEFLVELRERLAGRPGYGYLEVPDGHYDLGTAGWQVIYPHVSYFDVYSLCRIVTRAGWRVEATGTLFSGTLRWVELSANRPVLAGPLAAGEQPGLAARDQQLAAIRGLAARYRAERDRWRRTVRQLAAEGARPVLWGAGSRSVQFLSAVDPDRQLAAVVDVNPRKWGRYLPGGGHRVDPPERLAQLRPRAVVVTNPAYQDEIRRSLAELGVTAQLLLA